MCACVCACITDSKLQLFLSVSDIEEVSENFTGEVNIEEFWDSVQLEMISRAFFPSIYTSSFFVITFI